MPHATSGRRRPDPPIKAEPNPSGTANAGGSTQDESNEATNRSSTSNNHGGASDTMPVEQSFYRGGRSDAPTPSDRLGEPEPLLREMRMRPNPENLSSPSTIDDSFNFHTSFQDIGKKLKACNDTLGELQGLGVSHDVPLPELVLVGDQSAGKSSVMSGLANLDLPRSEGTCTRCPLHIRVSRNTDWSCRVSLSKEYQYRPPHDRPITENDVTEQDPFFPWKKLPAIQILEFKTVHDKTEIEAVLRWAQVAILNDDKNYQLFIPGSGATAQTTSIDHAAEEASAKFSPNVVSLEIKGPELPNLSFYDMPGIFQNPADARDDYLVNVVRNLSMSYIKRPSAIIMVSMPMNYDAENSFTFGLTRKLGASERTIGVLTKADLLPEDGNHTQWINIMSGTSHRTGLGYFITSRPQRKDLERLKQWEELMFEDSGVDKWPQAFRPFVERCGVEKLKVFLSHRLGEQFAKSLPHIEHKVKIHLGQICRQLSSLPELPDNVELEIQQSLLKFSEAARARVDDFKRHFNTLPQHFRDCILEIKPKFILKDQGDIPVLEISDGESDNDAVATNSNTPSKRRNMAPPSTPAKRMRGNPQATNGGSFIKPEESEDGHSFQSPTPQPRPPETKLRPPFMGFAGVGKAFRTLRQVRDEIQQKTLAGMPSQIPAEVYESLALQGITPWDQPMMVFLHETVRLLHNELSQAMHSAFENLRKRIVFQESKKHLKTFFDAHLEKAKDAMMQIYSDEKRQLVTFNEDAFERYRQEQHHLLTRFRHKMRMEAKGLVPKKPLEEWDKMSDAQRREDTKKREDELQKIGRDQFEREIKVVAYVRGYYRLAALRFADAISQCILCRMIPGIREDLALYLHKQLGLLPHASTEVYERLMEEDPAMAAKRETLKNEKAKFEKALASIEALNSGVAEGGADAASISRTNGGDDSADVNMENAELAEDGV